MRPTVSVIVPTFRRRRFLGPVVDALLAGTADEIVFVVDGSDDGSHEYLSRRASEDARLRAIMQANRGRPAAQQRGFDEATGEVALFLDDDLIPAMDIAAAHAAEHEAADDLVVVGAMPTTPPRWDARARLYDEQYREIVERWRRTGDVLGHLWGGHLSVRSEAFRRAGGLEPMTSMRYHDDWAFGLRCRAAGLRGKYCPEIVAHHAYERSADGFLRDVAAQAADRETMRGGAVVGPLGRSLAPEPAGIAAVVARIASRVPGRLRRALLRAALTTVDRLDGRLPGRSAVAATKVVGAIERNAVAGELARRRREPRRPSRPRRSPTDPDALDREATTGSQPIGVVVVSHNTRDVLAACLASLLAAGATDVVVVDNGSTDGSREMVRERFPTVRLEALDANLGYGAAANHGVRASARPVALVLNSDTVVPPGALEALAQHLARHPRAGLAGPRLHNPDGSLQPSCFPLPSAADALIAETGAHRLLRRIPWLRERLLRTWSHDRPRTVPWLLGAALAVRREAFARIGGFDESIFLYGEEIDLACRLAEAGYEAHFTPAATIVHAGGASSADDLSTYPDHIWASCRHLERHGSRADLAAFRAVMRAVLAARIARDAIARATARGERRALAGRRLETWRGMARDTRLRLR
ncbi:MAG TPA: glycosyltransferase [Solirubrobacteraceae bacterium]|nr:glycosyltransferase [Solirubrobacteraceae bacterium]